MRMVVGAAQVPWAALARLLLVAVRRQVLRLSAIVQPTQRAARLQLVGQWLVEAVSSGRQIVRLAVGAVVQARGQRERQALVAKPPAARLVEALVVALIQAPLMLQSPIPCSPTATPSGMVGLPGAPREGLALSECRTRRRWVAAAAAGAAQAPRRVEMEVMAVCRAVAQAGVARARLVVEATGASAARRRLP